MTLQSLEACLRTGWQDHATDPHRVVDSFPETLSLLGSDEACEVKLPDFARLIEHTLLGHLGVIGRVEPWLDLLQGRQFTLVAARTALLRMEFAVQISHGFYPEPPLIPDDQQLSGCANGLVAHCISDTGEAALARLVQFTHELPSATSNRAKAMAGAMNSLSFHLTLFPLADIALEVMVSAAVLSRDASMRSGQWRDVARAEHFLSMAHTTANQGHEAMEHALRCREIFAENAASAYELFLAAQALARGAAVAGGVTSARNALRTMEQLFIDIADAGLHARCSNLLDETRQFIEPLLARTVGQDLTTAPTAALPLSRPIS